MGDKCFGNCLSQTSVLFPYIDNGLCPIKSRFLIHFLFLILILLSVKGADQEDEMFVRAKLFLRDEFLVSKNSIDLYLIHFFS